VPACLPLVPIGELTCTERLRESATPGVRQQAGRTTWNADNILVTFVMSSHQSNIVLRRVYRVLSSSLTTTVARMLTSRENVLFDKSSNNFNSKGIGCQCCQKKSLADSLYTMWYYWDRNPSPAASNFPMTIESIN